MTPSYTPLSDSVFWSTLSDFQPIICYQKVSKFSGDQAAIYELGPKLFETLTTFAPVSAV